MAGRVGAAMTAEIGTMKVTEQIDALRCMAVNPIAYLVVPRFVACVVMVPILAFTAMSSVRPAATAWPHWAPGSRISPM